MKSIFALKTMFFLTIMTFVLTNGASESKIYALEDVFPNPFEKIPVPILTPKPGTFYSEMILNPTVIVENDNVHMIFRANNGSKEYTAVLGKAISGDGMSFFVENDPILIPTAEYDKHGLEDPRIVKINNTFYLTYVGNSGKYNESHICLASSPDLNVWIKHGVLLANEGTTWDKGNKKAALISPDILPNGKYVMYYLGESKPWHTCIGAAFSTDLLSWIPYQNNPIVCPRNSPLYFDSMGVEPGSTPIVTDSEIILIYNGWNVNKVHCTGYLAFDRNDGTTVKRRSDVPLIYPQLSWEMEGITPNVTFTEGVLYKSEMSKLYQWFFYYGAADTVIGLARSKFPPVPRPEIPSFPALWIVIICCFAALICYFGAGTVLKRAEGHSGWESVPHIDSLRICRDSVCLRICGKSIEREYENVEEGEEEE